MSKPSSVLQSLDSVDPQTAFSERRSGALTPQRQHFHRPGIVRLRKATQWPEVTTMRERVWDFLAGKDGISGVRPEIAEPHVAGRKSSAPIATAARSEPALGSARHLLLAVM